MRLAQVKLTAYGYYVDFQENAVTAPGNGDDPDNITIGIRAEGAIAIGDSMKFIYEADLAQQG